MSVSYTGDASMDDPALRDVERWKDKIEVRLDNRQVFFLFFGSALCACMLFVLGVIVGKRLESRGRAAAPDMQDPLAVLDRINAAGAGAAVAHAKPEQALTFPRALIGPPGRGRGASLASSPTSLASPAPAVPRPPVATPKPPVVAIKPPSAPRAAPVAKTPPAAAARPAAPRISSISPSASATPVAAPSPGPAPLSSASAPAAALSPSLPAAKGRFTLQLSSFPDRGDADLLAKRFASQGAYVVVSDIPGKGTWYRVRVGSYASSQEAIAAKGSFEKQTNVIAYIAGR